MDLITSLSLVEGYNSILIMVDWGLSKGVILCPCAKTLTWKGAAILLQDNLSKRFGLPDKMISDRDPRFAAHTFQELLKLLNICSNLTTAYHPQSDRATEQVNQEIEAYLAIYCMSHPEDWLHSLSTLEFTHNNRRHAEWVHIPSELIQGNSPISVPVTFSHTKYPSIKEKMKQMINDREEALATHELARTRIANRKESEGLAWHEEFEDELSQKDCSKIRRTIWNWRSLRTSDLLTKTPDELEDSQCVPCNLTVTLYWKQSLWE